MNRTSVSAASWYQATKVPAQEQETEGSSRGSGQALLLRPQVLARASRRLVARRDTSMQREKEAGEQGTQRILVCE